MGQTNNSYSRPGVAGAWRCVCVWGGWTINLQHDEPGSEGIDPAWPKEGGTWGLSGLPPANLTCWHPKVLHPSPAYQRSSKKEKEECSSHLERVLLTVSKWEQAVGGVGESRRAGGGLHRDFFLLSPVTSCQFTPQRIWNQNLIKILNK